MPVQVEVGAGVYALHLLETKREAELDVGGCVGVVGQLLVVMETIVVVAETECPVPPHAGLLPLREPCELFARTYEELHLHLFEFAHAKDELPCDDFVAESLADLCDAERNLHAARLLHVEEIDEDALCRFGSQIDGVRSVGHRTYLRIEHQVELAYLRPVARSRNGAGYLGVDDDLAQAVEVVGVERLCHAGVDFVSFRGNLRHARIGGAELLLVEPFPEAFAALFDLLVYLFVLFGNPVFDEHVGTVALFGVLVVYQRVVEGAHESRRFPYARVHEDGRVDAHDVVVELRHRIPPVALDVVLQFDAHLAVVVHGAQAVVYLARREYEAVFLTVCDEFLEKFFLCHYFVPLRLICQKYYKSRDLPSKRREIIEQRYYFPQGFPSGPSEYTRIRPQSGAGSGCDKSSGRFRIPP